MAKKVTVVISQAQGKHPVRRQLEEELAATLLFDSEIDVSIVPHLYDLTHDHTGMLFLKSIPGDLVICAWMYPRAARWVLDRAGIKGHEGVSLLKPVDADEDEEEEKPDPQGIGAWDLPKRKIYCLDLRDNQKPSVYLDEIRRIARECTVKTVDLLSWIGGQPNGSQLQRYLNPVVSTPPAAPVADENVRRRWYPVIDYSRCTNCMECIDFCLFGVYGLDSAERILVEQQDNCKKGCPACSRVCPENAIIFPEHKTPAIAGADVGTAEGLKVDLSKLFGAPSALEIAAAERDTELVADGREAVGLTVGIPRRQAAKSGSRDELDDLMDSLDALG